MTPEQTKSYVRETWFETYWWSPPLQESYGSPWDQWQWGRHHKTVVAAEEYCNEAQRKQPYIWYAIREVKLVKTLKGKSPSKKRNK